MSERARRWRFASLTTAALLAAASLGGAPPPPVPADLDQFMERVLVRRDENWRKLQQYVLDERETAEFLMPGRARAFGLAREYTWYIREGYFVRSPVRFDGVTLGEDERRAYERRWIAREREREARRAKKPGQPDTLVKPDDVDALLKLASEPQFVSAAYFLKFRFEKGQYALVGREPHEERSVLRIEYYPTRLFEDDEEAERRLRDPASKTRTEKREDEIERQMNKVSLVTLWIEPDAHQIVRYTFENVGFDFLPARWLVRVDDMRVSMRMSEPFPGVWLPRAIEARAAMTLANGTYDFRYATEYRNYRLADVKVKVR